MTAEEAINNIKEIQNIITDAIPSCDPNDDWGRYTKTLNTAIKALEELKAYKEAEEQGLLVKLPCKVGTPVYNTTWWDDVTETITVKGTTYYRSIIKHKVSKSNFSLRDLDKFGKEVFLTKEEAEAKLNKLQENEQEL